MMRRTTRRDVLERSARHELGTVDRERAVSQPIAILDTFSIRSLSTSVSKFLDFFHNFEGVVAIAGGSLRHPSETAD